MAGGILGSRGSLGGFLPIGPGAKSADFPLLGLGVDRLSTRDRRKSLILLFLCGLFLLSPSRAFAAVSAGDNQRSLVFDGVTRYYNVYVPASYTGATPVPLVIDFHGLTSNKTDQELISGFKQVSDTQGFIVAYPLGLFGLPTPEGASGTYGVDPVETLGPSWRAGDICCGRAYVEAVNDVGFAKALVAAIAAEASINLRKVYATGLSNGGALSHALACEAADVFAAVAPLAFPLSYDPLPRCVPSRPIAVLHFAGLTDTALPYGGGPLPAYPSISVASAAASFARWRAIDACDATSTTDVTGSSNCQTYTSCAAGVKVALCGITASAGGPLPGHILYFNPDLNLAQVAWNFLSQFESPAPQAAPPGQVYTETGTILSQSGSLITGVSTGTFRYDPGDTCGSHPTACVPGLDYSSATPVLNPGTITQTATTVSGQTNVEGPFQTWNSKVTGYLKTYAPCSLPSGFVVGGQIICNNNILDLNVQPSLGPVATDLVFPTLKATITITSIAYPNWAGSGTFETTAVHVVNSDTASVPAAQSAGALLSGQGSPGGIDYDITPTAPGDLSVAYVTPLLSEIGDGLNDPPSFNFQAPSDPLQLWDIRFTGAVTQPVILTFGYDDTHLLPATNEADLRIHHFENGEWVELPGPGGGSQIVDTQANTITAQTTSFSEFSLGGPPLAPPSGGGCPDLNGDASVNVLDLVLVANHFGQTSSDAAFDATVDCNADNVINIFDLVTVARAVGT